MQLCATTFDTWENSQVFNWHLNFQNRTIFEWVKELQWFFKRIVRIFFFFKSLIKARFGKSLKTKNLKNRASRAELFRQKLEPKPSQNEPSLDSDTSLVISHTLLENSFDFLFIVFSFYEYPLCCRYDEPKFLPWEVKFGCCCIKNVPWLDNIKLNVVTNSARRELFFLLLLL